MPATLLPLLLASLWLFAPEAAAYHEASEPSDGTVRSFIAVDPPKAAPNIPLQTASGARTSLHQFQGRVTLLNLWATWCPPCIRELPALDRLQGKFDPQRFKVLAVSLDAQGIAAARPFFQRLKIRHLDLYADAPRALGRFFPIDVLPATFILNAEGQVTHYLRSYVDWDEPLAEDMVKHLIGEGGH